MAKYCVAKNKFPIREASWADIRLFVTAEELDALLATDEWPLRHVIEQQGGQGRLCDTLDVVHLMETSGAITADQRRETVRIWCAYGEILLDGWEARYKALYGEPPPDGQAPRSHNA